jgi:hypothetical protein
MSFPLLFLVFGILAGAGAFYILRFKTEHKGQSKLLRKYEDLLKPIIAEKKINLKQSSLTQLIINYREAKTHTTFALYEIENKLFVTWAHNSANFGDRGKEWCFQKDSDQETMYLQIRKDIEEYLKLVRN